LTPLTDCGIALRNLKHAFAVLDKEGEAFYGYHVSCGEVEAIYGLKAHWGHWITQP
jgi:hypothetical protein